jgi:hypothetical protein
VVFDDLQPDEYVPFTDGLDGQICYYSTTQQLVGDLYFTDVMSECAVGSGMRSGVGTTAVSLRPSGYAVGSLPASNNLPSTNRIT